MTRLEQSEHEVHALREEIRTPPHGGPPEGMRPDSHVIGELQRKLDSLAKKYQLLKHAAKPQVRLVGIPTPKPEPRVQVFGVPAREKPVAGSLPGFRFSPAEDSWSSMRADEGGSLGRARRGGRSETQTDEGHTPPGMRGDWWHCAGLDLWYFKADSDSFFCCGWCFSCSTDKNLSKMGLVSLNKSPLKFYVRWRLMKFAQNDFWTPRSIGQNQNLKERIRG